jgi:hypothetical protein
MRHVHLKAKTRTKSYLVYLIGVNYLSVLFDLGQHKFPTFDGKHLPCRGHVAGELFAIPSIILNKVKFLGSPDQRVITKTYVEKQAKNRRRIFSKLRNP